MRHLTLPRWLRALVGVGLLSLLVRRVNLHELQVLARHGNTAQLALALSLLFFANPFVQTLRLHVLVARYTQTLATTLKVFTVGAFFNTMLPSNVGGDAVKLLYLKRMRAESWGAPFALLMLHRASGMMVLLVGASIQAALEHEHLARALRAAQVQTHVPWRSILLGVALTACGALGWLVLSGSIRARIASFLGGFLRECQGALLEIGARALTALVAWTLAFHLLRMVAFYLLVQYAGCHIEFWDLLIVLAATAVAGVIPISVGGLGLMEGAISVMLALFGVPESTGLLAGLANRLILLAGAAIGGALYIADKRTT
jgi:uncharacterized membrane protein YbhN (UPF0104 family)